MKVVFLGTGGSVPTKERGLPAVWFEWRGHRYLLDCGEGTQRQMRKAGLPFMKLDKILITHFHADHCLGLGGLIQTMDLFERTEPLEICGPKGTHDVIQKVISTGHFVLEGFDLEITELDPKGIETFFSDNDVTLKCAPLRHSVPCVGYSIEETHKHKFNREKAISLGVPEGPLFSQLQAGVDIVLKDGRKIEAKEVLGPAKVTRKLAYCSDTIPCPEGISLSQDADLLIHESTLLDELAASADKAGHSTAKQAAEVAIKANVKELILTHFSQRYTDEKVLEKEAKGVFKNSRAAVDFLEVEI